MMTVYPAISEFCTSEIYCTTFTGFVKTKTFHHTNICRTGFLMRSLVHSQFKRDSCYAIFRI